VTSQRRGFSTLLAGAVTLSAVACAAPVQQAPTVAAAPGPSVAPAPAPQAAAHTPPAEPAPVVEPASDVVATAGPSADEIVARVQAVYDKSNAVKLGFKQRYLAGVYDPKSNSTGSVIAEKPGHMSWRYGNGNRVVVGGELVQIYAKASKQLFLAPASKTQFPVALSFTFGQGKLERAFKFTKQDAQRMKFPSGHVVSGDPLKPSSAFTRVFFYVDGQTYRVRPRRPRQPQPLRLRENRARRHRPARRVPSRGSTRYSDHRA
jgi:hypothetical protein